MRTEEEKTRKKSAKGSQNGKGKRGEKREGGENERHTERSGGEEEGGIKEWIPQR